MRNLKIIRLEEVRVPTGLPLKATAWDTSNDSIICAFGPTLEKPFIELKRKKSNVIVKEETSTENRSEFTSITSWDAPCPLPELDCDEIIHLQYFAEIKTSCLVLAGGDIVAVREDPSPHQEKIEIVGSVDAGILAAAWAPDGELLALITRGDTLLLMSKAFEPFKQTDLSAEDLKASKHVSVGWGKKETQFHGKRAKALRDPTIPETVDEGKPSSLDKGTVSISWRGDGSYFAVNSVVLNHRRVVRVFSRDAVLDSVSEPVDGLESALSWRPSGNLISSIKRLDDRLEVVFFERNGLRHGEFQLRLAASESKTWGSLTSLSWNKDSTVLAICFNDRVQFWTMGNYHYYLKQEVFLGQAVAKLHANAVQWHPFTPFRSSISTEETLIDLTQSLAVSRGTVNPPNDYGTVMVIDGKILKVTPLKYAGVPPPMSFCDIEFKDNIVDCYVSLNGDRIAVLTTKTIELCDWKMEPKRSFSSSAKGNQDPSASLRHSKTISNRSYLLPGNGDYSPNTRRFTRLVLSEESDVYLLAPPQLDFPAKCAKVGWPTGDSDLQFIEVEIPTTAEDILVDRNQKSTWLADQGTVSQLFSSRDQNFDGSEILQMSRSNQESAIFALPENFQTSKHVQAALTYHSIALMASGVLEVDGHTLVRNCTSFLLGVDHLIFTTSHNLLKFVHLAPLADMTVPQDTPEVDERCRNVEKGAKLVTVTPSTYAVILQMPRGNLETIYPRILVLSGIRRRLQLQNYLEAFLACQNHQVDMNILYDYDPDAFISHVSQFIDQLKKASRVDEFLSKLKEEDVTKTLYRDTLSHEISKTFSKPNGHVQEPEASLQSSSETDHNSNKTNRICNEFLKILPSKSAAHLQNIITAHVRKRPPDLKSALLVVSTLRQSSHEEADLAVSHLCFLTDSNRLYDTSLALYDLELALLVAQNAQRDPREYIPFLQSLQALPDYQRRFKIDDHLRNHTRALESLYAMSAHDELENYAVKHQLYPNAINLYKYEQVHLERIRRLYADRLSSQSQHNSAAILYESLNDFVSAYPLYALAHQWRESLTCAALIPLDESKLRDLAMSLATTCADESRDYRAAAAIHTEYLNDIPTAARLLCKGSYFADATRILALHSLTDDIQRIIGNGLNEKFGEIIELVADCRSQLTAQLPRIKELQQKKEDDPLAFYGGDAMAPDGDTPDIPDNVSLAATDASTTAGQSLFTRYGSNASKFGGTVSSNVSRKTSKTKRREERKRARGKKGSVYEEEYLVSSIGRLIHRVNGVHDEVKRLVSGLLRRGMQEQAARVEEIMQEISEMCIRTRMEVWPVNESNLQAMKVGGKSDDQLNGPGTRPSGADGVLWDSQVGTENARSKPHEVKSWIRNDLIV